MVSGRTGLGEGGLLVNGDGRKDGGFGDRRIFFFFFFADGEFAKFGPAGMEGDSRRGGEFLCKSGVVGEGVGGQVLERGYS